MRRLATLCVMLNGLLAQQACKNDTYKISVNITFFNVTPAEWLDIATQLNSIDSVGDLQKCDWDDIPLPFPPPSQSGTSPDDDRWIWIVIFVSAFFFCMLALAFCQVILVFWDVVSKHNFRTQKQRQAPTSARSYAVSTNDAMSARPHASGLSHMQKKYTLPHAQSSRYFGHPSQGAQALVKK